MKFLVESLNKCSPRLGILKEIEKLPNVTLESPIAMLYTRGGSIPYITNEVFKVVCKQSQIIQIPLVSTYNFEDAMTEFQGDISEFVGMKECVSCVTVQDPGNYTQPGHHMNNNIPIWTRQGKVLLNPKLYMNSIESYKPDMYYLLSDGDTNMASSTKRVDKAVRNTIEYHKQCLERHVNSEVLKKSFVMGSIAGGYNLKARKECIDNLSTYNSIGGFLIDGLHNNGPEVELLQAKEIRPIVHFIVDNLPHDKLRAMHGCWNPVTILNLVQLGIDLFDTSYCYLVTERSCALTFSLDVAVVNEQYEINLHKTQYADDFRPILFNCTCLACARYSRGYIRHLVVVQELLGPLLLTIHNVHHYLKFFEKIRECIKKGTLNEFQEHISKQFENNEVVDIQSEENTSTDPFIENLNYIQNESIQNEINEVSLDNIV